MDTGFRGTLFVTFLSAIFLLFLPVSVYSEPFKMIGSRDYGMGGAGVAGTADEHTGLWNPGNLSTNRDDDFGIQAGVQVQSTKDFLKEAEDLESFESDVGSLSSIFGADYSDTDSFAGFTRLNRELTDINRSDQGMLGDVTGGINIRGWNWAISANTISSFSAKTRVNTDDVTFGSVPTNGDALVQYATGDVSNDSPKRSPSGSDYVDAANKVNQVLQDEISDCSEGGDLNSNFGFNSTTNCSEVAEAIAYRAEQRSGNLSANDLEESSKSLIPNLVDLGTGGSDDGFDTEDQRVALNLARIDEFTLHYSRPRPVFSALGNELYLGANVKFIEAQLIYDEFDVFGKKDFGDTVDELEGRNVNKDQDFGVDAGLVIDARRTIGLKIGLTGKYLNEPEFEYGDSHPIGDTTLTIDRQFRVGISGTPLYYIPGPYFGDNWWKINVDYDITENETLLDKYKTQYLAIGNEINIINQPWLNLALRAGFRRNLAEDDEGDIYTAGLGLNIGYFNLDISGAQSTTESKNEDNEKQPSLTGGSANISFRF